MNKQKIKELIGENAVILEIGAADGSDTRELMKLGTVYAFEPEPKNIELLKNIEGLNLFEGAVSDTDGTFYFNRSRTADNGALRLSGSLLQPKNHLTQWDWIHFDETIEVLTVKLDTFCKDMPVIDFVWCDVQGAEAKVIRGGIETFKRVRYFYTEYSNDELYGEQPDLLDIISLLPDFDILEDYGGDVLLKNRNL